MIRNDKRVQTEHLMLPALAVGIVVLVCFLWNPICQAMRDYAAHERAVKRYCIEHNIVITEEQVGCYWVSTGKNSGYMRPQYERVFILPDGRRMSSINYLMEAKQ